MLLIIYAMPDLLRKQFSKATDGLQVPMICQKLSSRTKGRGLE